MPSCGASGSTNCVGNTMRRPAPGQPRVDPGICIDDFVVTEVEATRDVRKRVFLARDRRLQRADDARWSSDRKKTCGSPSGSAYCGGGGSAGTGGGVLARHEYAASRESPQCCKQQDAAARGWERSTSQFRHHTHLCCPKSDPMPVKERPASSVIRPHRGRPAAADNVVRAGARPRCTPATAPRS